MGNLTDHIVGTEITVDLLTFGGLVLAVMMDHILGTKITLDRIGLKPGQRVLEIGAGWGRLLIPAAQHVLPGGEVIGLDIRAGAIEQLKAQAAQEGIVNLKAVVGDATQAHFPPESFDVIYLCTVLGEITDRKEALRQCYAALKPDGILSITEIIPDPHFQSRVKVRQLAEEAGFRLTARYGSWHFFTANFSKSPSAN